MSLSIVEALEECQHSSSASAHARLARLVQAGRDGAMAAELAVLLRPALVVWKREAPVERVIRFVVALCTAPFEKEKAESALEFVEGVLKEMLALVRCADKAVRFRAAQVVAGILNGLNADAEISDEIYESVEVEMLERLRDKAPPVRLQAVRSLARLQQPDDEGSFEGDVVTQALRMVLKIEKNKDVRKAVLASIAVCDSTLSDIVGRTRDISDDVRKVAYIVLCGKVNVKVLSITQRAQILRRGLSDRHEAVKTAALDLAEKWIETSGGDAPGLVEVVRLLDVESNESVAEIFLTEIVGRGQITVASVIQSLSSDASLTANGSTDAIIEPAQALVWRVMCGMLKANANVRGMAAATNLGTAAVIDAAAAAENLDLLEQSLPQTVVQYVELVSKNAESDRFSAWQLLRLAHCLELSDSASRNNLKTYLLELLREIPSKNLDEEEGSFCIAGAGGDGQWERTLAETLAIVETDVKEWTNLILSAVNDIRIQHLTHNDDFPGGWAQALTLSSLALERASSIGNREHEEASSLEETLTFQDLTEALIIPALQHESPAVRLYAIRNVGLLCCIDAEMCFQYSKLLIAVLTSSDEDLVCAEAAKALGDLCLLRGSEINDAFEDHGSLHTSLLSSLTAVGCGKAMETIAEALAKLLIFERVQDASQILKELLLLYISGEAAASPRLQQCLAVFFATFSKGSASFQKVICGAFMPAVRAAVTVDRKSATQLIRYLHQLVQSPIAGAPSEERGQHTLANDILCEIILYPKSTVTNPYIAALAKVVANLDMASFGGSNVRLSFVLMDRARQVVEAATASADLNSAEKRMIAADTSEKGGFDEEDRQACDEYIESYEERMGKTSTTETTKTARKRSTGHSAKSSPQRRSQRTGGDATKGRNGVSDKGGADDDNCSLENDSAEKKQPKTRKSAKSSSTKAATAEVVTKTRSGRVTRSVLKENMS